MDGGFPETQDVSLVVVSSSPFLKAEHLSEGYRRGLGGLQIKGHVLSLGLLCASLREVVKDLSS